MLWFCQTSQEKKQKNCKGARKFPGARELFRPCSKKFRSFQTKAGNDDPSKVGCVHCQKRNRLITLRSTEVKLIRLRQQFSIILLRDVKLHVIDRESVNSFIIYEYKRFSCDDCIIRFGHKGNEIEFSDILHRIILYSRSTQTGKKLKIRTLHQRNCHQAPVGGARH